MPLKLRYLRKEITIGGLENVMCKENIPDLESINIAFSVDLIRNGARTVVRRRRPGVVTDPVDSIARVDETIIVKRLRL